MSIILFRKGPYPAVVDSRLQLWRSCTRWNWFQVERFLEKNTLHPQIIYSKNYFKTQPADLPVSCILWGFFNRVRVPLECWHYIPISTIHIDNTSRGCLPMKLTRANSWWVGPPSLSTPLQFWTEPNPPDINDLEFSVTPTSLVIMASSYVMEGLLRRLSHVLKAFCLPFCIAIIQKRNELVHYGNWN